MIVAPRRPKRHPIITIASGELTMSSSPMSMPARIITPWQSAATPPADHDHSKSRPGECCGLFPLMAFADGLPSVLAPARLTSTVIPVMTDALVGRGPDRIIRPPIA